MSGHVSYGNGLSSGHSVVPDDESAPKENSKSGFAMRLLGQHQQIEIHRPDEESRSGLLETKEGRHEDHRMAFLHLTEWLDANKDGTEHESKEGKTVEAMAEAEALAEGLQDIRSELSKFKMEVRTKLRREGDMQAKDMDLHATVAELSTTMANIVVEVQQVKASCARLEQEVHTGRKAVDQLEHLKATEKQLEDDLKKQISRVHAKMDQELEESMAALRTEMEDITRRGAGTTRSLASLQQAVKDTNDQLLQDKTLAEALHTRLHLDLQRDVEVLRTQFADGLAREATRAVREEMSGLLEERVQQLQEDMRPLDSWGHCLEQQLKAQLKGCIAEMDGLKLTCQQLEAGQQAAKMEIDALHVRVTSKHEESTNHRREDHVKRDMDAMQEATELCEVRKETEQLKDAVRQDMDALESKLMVQMRELREQMHGMLDKSAAVMAWKNPAEGEIRSLAMADAFRKEMERASAKLLEEMQQNLHRELANSRPAAEDKYEEVKSRAEHALRFATSARDEVRCLKDEVKDAQQRHAWKVEEMQREVGDLRRLLNKATFSIQQTWPFHKQHDHHANPPQAEVEGRPLIAKAEQGAAATSTAESFPANPPRPAALSAQALTRQLQTQIQQKRGEKASPTERSEWLTELRVEASSDEVA